MFGSRGGPKLNPERQRVGSRGLGVAMRENN